MHQGCDMQCTQEQSIRFNNIKYNVGKTAEAPLCWMFVQEMRLYLTYWVNLANLPKRSTNRGMIVLEGMYIDSFMRSYDSTGQDFDMNMEQKV